jgi:NADPH:quinone reductase-like Zn-dependent oxidoreductase
MRAAVYDRFGPPEAVRVAEVPTPGPRTGEILVRVRASVVGATENVARQGIPRYSRMAFGFFRPRHPILGADFAGDVAALGPGVTRFAVGEPVFGTVAPAFRAHAEYLCVPENGAVATKPDGLTYPDAVALVDATALHFLRDKAKVRPGEAVLVNGASGSVGAVAVQYAVHLGATVTAVCSGPSLDLVQGLGAEHALDYTTTDPTRTGATYDVVFDVAGTSSYPRCRPILRPGGRYLTTAPSPGILLRTARGDRAAMVAFAGLRPPADKRRDLGVITDLVREGALRPVLDSVHPLAGIVDAHRKVVAGGKRGTVVVTM